MAEHIPFEEERALLPKLCQHLEARGHRVLVARDAAEARALVLETVPAKGTVGIPGTLTARQLGLPEALIERGNDVYEHWELRGRTAAEARAGENSSDWFICGVNALTAEGEIVNCDGFGNRVAATAYGPKNRLYILGLNKICPNLPTAFNRIRTYAARTNALRFHPELEGNEEALAAAADEICRVFTIIDKVPSSCESSVVILVQESLGY